MKNNHFCESCCMPLDNNNLGTETDGSYSNEYCWHCYQKGEFTNPFLTLTEMKHHVQLLMERHHEDNKRIYQAMNMLPELKRWYKPARI